MGTITIYSPVMKPAFPAVVLAMPICCSEAPQKRTHPAIMPPGMAETCGAEFSCGFFEK
jgi:hypothetical protein